MVPEIDRNRQERKENLLSYRFKQTSAFIRARVLCLYTNATCMPHKYRPTIMTIASESVAWFKRYKRHD